jgi:hypothetical protein
LATYTRTIEADEVKTWVKGKEIDWENIIVDYTNEIKKLDFVI